MCASHIQGQYPNTPAELPTFMLPRACMGIVVRYFLEYDKDPAEFQRELAKKFPCCIQAIDDLRLAFRFWNDVRRCVTTKAETLGAEEVRDAINAAHKILCRQQERLGLHA
eukprot:gb/GFBE01036076.1/.p1 GENE.gb/GFBE01036076.1/~~gb/GFBE01036076.1/.p1  ORF type:complete len:111 (+),score=16.35 gb/GFBE01036076.1/:1-333(+)